MRQLELPIEPDAIEVTDPASLQAFVEGRAWWPGCGIPRDVHVKRGFRIHWPEWKPEADRG